MKTINTKQEVLKKQGATEHLDGEQLDAFGLLGQADDLENQAVIFYKNMQEIFPQWYDTLDGLIEESIRRKGIIASLRDDISDEVEEAISDGERMTQQELNEDDLLPTAEIGIDGGLGIPFIENQARSPEFAYGSEKEFDKINSLLLDAIQAKGE